MINNNKQVVALCSAVRLCINMKLYKIVRQAKCRESLLSKNEKGHMILMMECVECGYSGDEFGLVINGYSKGAFTYVAKCLRCGSRKVKHLPEYYESCLRIHVEKETQKESEHED